MNDFISQFQKYYYNSLVWGKTYWLGIPTYKCPFDLWIYQEILFHVRPDLIIETGTAAGGSAFFLATICDLMNHGEVITIDIIDVPQRPKHPRITYLKGSSTSPEILSKIKQRAGEGKKVLVILDSDHSYVHVLQEIKCYQSLVSTGSYLIVEDTIVNGHPVLPSFGPGPMEAVKEFLKETTEFEIDKSREKFLITFNPNGYLLKRKQA